MEEKGKADGNSLSEGKEFRTHPSDRSIFRSLDRIVCSRGRRPRSERSLRSAPGDDAPWGASPGQSNPASRQDSAQAVKVQDAREALLLHHRGGERGFLFLQGADFFLDGVPGDQAVGHHLVLLANAVGAVDGLRLHRRVPPRVEEHDVARGGEVEARARGLELKQENRNGRVGLKLVHQRLPVFGLAREQQVGEAARI